MTTLFKSDNFFLQVMLIPYKSCLFINMPNNYVYHFIIKVSYRPLQFTQGFGSPK